MVCEAPVPNAMSRVQTQFHDPVWCEIGTGPYVFNVYRPVKCQVRQEGAGISTNRTFREPWLPMGDADGEEAAGAPQGGLCVRRLPNARRGGNKPL